MTKSFIYDEDSKMPKSFIHHDSPRCCYILEYDIVEKKLHWTFYDFRNLSPGNFFCLYEPISGGGKFWVWKNRKVWKATSRIFINEVGVGAVYYIDLTEKEYSNLPELPVLNLKK